MVYKRQFAIRYHPIIFRDRQSAPSIINQYHQITAELQYGGTDNRRVIDYYRVTHHQHLRTTDPNSTLAASVSYIWEFISEGFTHFTAPINFANSFGVRNLIIAQSRFRNGYIKRNIMMRKGWDRHKCQSPSKISKRAAENSCNTKKFKSFFSLIALLQTLRLNIRCQPISHTVPYNFARYRVLKHLETMLQKIIQALVQRQQVFWRCQILGHPPTTYNLNRHRCNRLNGLAVKFAATPATITTIIVSPMARDIASKIALTIPGKAAGRITCLIVSACVAPSAEAHRADLRHRINNI